MATALAGTGKKLGGAFVEIRANLGKLKSGLVAAKSLVASSMRGLTKVATLPITISIKAVRGALSVAVNLVRSAMRRIKQLLFMTGIGGGALIWGFAKFETAMRKATAVSETTGEQFAKMSEMARAQAMRLNKSAVELAEGFYFLGSAGLSVTDQIKAFPAVATLAKAAVIDMGSAAEMVVDTMKGFQIGFENTTHVTDVMAKAVVSSNQTFAQLGESLSYVAGIAEMTHNSLEDTVAAISKMADVGIKGSRAGVYMRAGLIRLMAPMSEARTNLEKLGVSVYDSTGRMKPFVQLIGELGDALKGVSEEQRNAAFKALFGQRAIAGQIAIFRDGKQAVQDFSDKLKDAGGATEQIAQKQLNSLGQQFGKLIRIITNTATTIGKALSPALREMVADLQKQFKKLDDFFKKHELTIAKFAMQGYKYLKVFSKFVAEIADDISTNWSERWVFMQKVVKIQLLAVREIVSATFDDVWSVLKSGALAYGKTLYEVFKKVFTDIARNMGGWISGVLKERKVYNEIYGPIRDDLVKNRLEAYGEKTHTAGGYETEEYQAVKRQAAALANKEMQARRKAGDFESFYPETKETETWGDLFKRKAADAKQTYDEMAEHTKKVFDTIKKIETAAAGEIADAMPKAWKDKWQDFKMQLKEAKLEVDAWYEDQKKTAKDAADEIAAATGESGGTGTQEPTTGKTSSIVGVKEMWQRMVEGLSTGNKELSELQKQTGLLADIRNGKGPLGVTIGPRGPQIDRDIIRENNFRPELSGDDIDRIQSNARGRRDSGTEFERAKIRSDYYGQLQRQNDTMIGELRRIGTGINKLQPIGAVGP